MLRSGQKEWKNLTQYTKNVYVHIQPKLHVDDSSWAQKDLQTGIRRMKKTLLENALTVFQQGIL